MLGKICENDQCAELLYPVDANGVGPQPEEARWLTLGIGEGDYDVCSPACAVALLHDTAVLGDYEAYVEMITSVQDSIDEGRRAQQEAAAFADRLDPPAPAEVVGGRAPEDPPDDDAHPADPKDSL